MTRAQPSQIRPDNIPSPYFPAVSTSSPPALPVSGMLSPVLPLMEGIAGARTFRCRSAPLLNRLRLAARRLHWKQIHLCLAQLFPEGPVEDLPLTGRNFVQLAQLAAGANEGRPEATSNGNRPDDRRQTAAVSANAQSD